MSDQDGAEQLLDGAERHIEMTWKCSTCEHQNLGRHKDCQQCGHPKDASEQYEMPENPELAASVTDEDLVKMAKAGPDWRCAYCGSDQQRADHSCGQCGAAIGTGTEVPDDVVDQVPIANWWARNGRIATWIAGGAAGLVVLIVILVWNKNRPRDYDAKVMAVAWEHQIEVERYAIRKHDGFKENLPSAAMDVTSLGQKVHHHEQVLDHYDTEHYTVQVPDGYRTEHYTAQESCGQTCTSRPKTCSQSCSSKKNGFASCRQVCSGGGQSCSTKYCSVSKTRQVAKTRSESRSRQVPRYRSEPRYAEGFSWRAWEWAHERTAVEKGTDVAALKWPSGALTAMSVEGEKERDTRKATYVVSLQYGDELLKFAVHDEATAAKFATGSTHEIHKERDDWMVDGASITPLLLLE